MSAPPEPTVTRKPVARLRDWAERFEALLAERLAMPFEWGRQDCALFAADCVHAITGIDPAEDLRGAYKTMEGAARVLARKGGLEALCDERLLGRIDPARACVGDVGLTQQLTAGGPALLVCGGTHWLGAGPSGWVSVPAATVTVAWRVA